MTEVTAVTPGGLAGAGLSNQDFTKELCEALEAGISVEAYLAGREGGISHDELMEARQYGYTYESYVAARLAGASVDEVRAFTEHSHPELGVYAKLRGMGASHAQIEEVVAIDDTVADYYKARLAGATHYEVIEARECNFSCGLYAKARESGIAHDDLIDSRHKRVPQGPYTAARRAGISHANICAISQRYGAEELNPYIVGRAVGASHADMYDAMGRDLNIGAYTEGRSADMSHDMLISAAADGRHPGEYVHSHQLG